MLALLGLLCALTLAAQDRQSRIQQVMAIQEMRADGLSAAHPTLPIGSKVRIRNPANALTIEATIVEQLPAANQQVIDISSAAALALDIGAGGPVIVTTLSQSSPASSNARQKPDVETETELDKSSLPFNITINNYITNPDKPNAAPDGPVTAEDSQNRPIRINPPQDAEIKPDISGQSGEAPVIVSEPAVQQPVVAVELPDPPPVTVSEPVVQPPVQVAARPEAPPSNGSLSLFDKQAVVCQIIPSTLPDPRSKKVYRLLVENCDSLERANLVCRQLDKAGFEVVLEQAGNKCRVFASGISASQVYNAAQRLGAIGFGQVWIQE
jgi:hypothetical protein